MDARPADYVLAWKQILLTDAETLGIDWSPSLRAQLLPAFHSERDQNIRAVPTDFSKAGRGAVQVAN
jgi:hypothetical protein